MSKSLLGSQSGITRIAVTTIYEFTPAAVEDYLKELCNFMAESELEEFIAIGKITRIDIDDDGSKATTIHEALDDEARHITEN